MPVFNRIGAAEARAELAVARATGNKINFKFSDTSDVVELYVILEQRIGAKTVGSGLRSGGGRRVGIGILMLTIPVQDGFAVMTDDQRPIREGSRIEWPQSSGRYFYVDEETEDIQQKSNGYVYVVKATEHKTSTLGARA